MARPTPAFSFLKTPGAGVTPDRRKRETRRWFHIKSSDLPFPASVDGTERHCPRDLDRRTRDNLESSTPARVVRVRPHSAAQLLGPLRCLESQRQALEVFRSCASADFQFRLKTRSAPAL